MNRSRTLSRIALGASALAAAAVLVHAQRPSAATASSPAVAGKPSPAPPAIAALPQPGAFVSGLDLECFRTPGPSLEQNLQLTHLNPVLLGLGMPSHRVGVRELVETCMPVTKNQVQPTAIDWIRHVDFACYKLVPETTTVTPTLTLRHLNPVLAQLIPHNVRLLQPETLCVPVMKNGVEPDNAITHLVKYLDLECWDVEELTTHPSFTVTIHHLNPQLTGYNRHNVASASPNRKLCVPVRKGDQEIPANVLNIIQWVDLERFAVQLTTAPEPNPPTVRLGHLNPLFVGLPDVEVTLQQIQGLMVPVSKNGATPP